MADESGFYLLPSVVRTYAPVGETPLLRSKLSHDHLSVRGAVSLEGKLYFQVHEHAISGEEVVAFREAPAAYSGQAARRLGQGDHRSKMIKQFLPRQQPLGYIWAIRLRPNSAGRIW